MMIRQSVFRPVVVRQNACGTVFVEQQSVHAARIVLERESVSDLIAALSRCAGGRIVGGAGAESEESTKPLPPSMS